jgi:hypothetical protein
MTAVHPAAAVSKQHNSQYAQMCSTVSSINPGWKARPDPLERAIVSFPQSSGYTSQLDEHRHGVVVTMLLP